MATDYINTNKTGRRIRQRIRGVVSGRTGKTVGISSLAVPVLSWIVYDLQKPDSVLRTVITHAVDRLLKTPSKTRQTIDITDKVEIIEESKSENNQ